MAVRSDHHGDPSPALGVPSDAKLKEWAKAICAENGYSAVGSETLILVRTVYYDHLQRRDAKLAAVEAQL